MACACAPCSASPERAGDGFNVFGISIASGRGGTGVLASRPLGAAVGLGAAAIVRTDMAVRPAPNPP